MLEVQQDTWHDTRTSWGRWNSYSEHTHTHTLTQAHTLTPHLKTLEKLNHPHFSIMPLPTVRGGACCSIMMIKYFNPRRFCLFSFCSDPCLPNDKRLFMILLFSSNLYCLTYVVPYISLTPPWTQRPFNAVDKWWVAGLCSGTSWHSARCWRNTYPHSPTSNSFSGIDARQHHGQIILSQGKLPIVHAVKQDETWNMLAHNGAVWISVTIFPLTCSHFLSL